MTQGQRRHIDLNADLGEGFPNDDALLDIVSSANVCASAYAGSLELTRRTIAAAAQRDVRIGAHVGYADRENFGRRPFDIGANALRDSLVTQVETCLEGARQAGAVLTYVKPHGALYHAAAGEGEIVTLLVDLAARYGLGLLHQPNTALLRRAIERGVPCVKEGFADRRYLPSGRLVPRRQPGALIEGREEVAEQALSLARGEGSLAVESICLHGDDRHALRNARAVRAELIGGGFTIRAPNE